MGPDEQILSSQSSVFFGIATTENQMEAESVAKVWFIWWWRWETLNIDEYKIYNG